MSFVKVPGSTAKHAIITDQCRNNRGDLDAFEEAVSRLRDEYVECLPGNTGKDHKFHLVLSIERPN